MKQRRTSCIGEVLGSVEEGRGAISGGEKGGRNAPQHFSVATNVLFAKTLVLVAILLLDFSLRRGIHLENRVGLGALAAIQDSPRPSPADPAAVSVLVDGSVCSFSRARRSLRRPLDSDER
eukprot:scaffold1509_cov240-Pinguiococcus_pyrenoidosus.AAC.18